MRGLKLGVVIRSFDKMSSSEAVTGQLLSLKANARRTLSHVDEVARGSRMEGMRKRSEYFECRRVYGDKDGRRGSGEADVARLRLFV